MSRSSCISESLPFPSLDGSRWPGAPADDNGGLAPTRRPDAAPTGSAQHVRGNGAWSPWSRTAHLFHYTVLHVLQLDIYVLITRSNVLD
jgi:hypothetical protein